MYKRFRLYGLALVAVVISYAPATQAQSFESKVYNDTIHVHGRVLPYHHVIVDKNGEVIKVVSNTDGLGALKVYSEQLSASNRIAETPEIRNQYEKIMKNQKLQIGTVYERSEDTNTTKSILLFQLTSLLTYKF